MHGPRLNGKARTPQGAMVELVDTPVLGTGIARCEGSSPFRPTTRDTGAAIVKWHNRVLVMLSRRFDPRWWHHIIHTLTHYQLPGAWPTSVAEQHSVRKNLTP